MAGRFEGLSDAGWSMFEEVFPEKEKKGPGMPASHPRKVMNSLLYILIAGGRWCDLPKGGLGLKKVGSGLNSLIVDQVLSEYRPFSK